MVVPAYSGHLVLRIKFKQTFLYFMGIFKVRKVGMGFFGGLFFVPGIFLGFIGSPRDLLGFDRSL